MAWLYEKSSTWRKLVAVTRESPMMMLGFTVAMVAGPYYLGQQVMYSSNPGLQPGVTDKAREDLLRSRMGVEHQVLARAQKARLQVLLDEVKDGKDGARYKAALNGETLGTLSSGSTMGAAAIKRTEQ